MHNDDDIEFDLTKAWMNLEWMPADGSWSSSTRLVIAERD